MERNKELKRHALSLLTPSECSPITERQLNELGIYRLPTEVHQLMADAIDRFRADPVWNAKEQRMEWVLTETQTIAQNQSRLLTIIKEFVENRHPGMVLNNFIELLKRDTERLPQYLQQAFWWGIWYEVIPEDMPHEASLPNITKLLTE